MWDVKKLGIPKVDKEVTRIESFSKTVKVSTDNYYLEDAVVNEDGLLDVYGDFSDTNWKEEFECESMTLESILDQIPKFISSIKDRLTEAEKLQASFIVESCKGWIQDEAEFVYE